MLAEFIDVSGWSHEQWLAASLLVLIVLTVLVVVHRLVKLLKLGRKPRQLPNLRPLRRTRYRYREEGDEQ